MRCCSHHVATLSLSLLAAAAALSCAGAERLEPATNAAEHTVGFVGYVYDGAAGTRLSSYAISRQGSAAPKAGTVDPDGRYTLGDFSVWEDFTVLIDADGYRSFRSHNAMVGLPDDLIGNDQAGLLATHQLLHYDAYLFPADLLAPAVSFTIETGLPTEAPSGKIRLRPTAPPSLANEGSETPGGVPGQVWVNDEDLQGETLSASFSAGTFALKEGDLVYGVTYQVDIYDVPGYQPFKGSYAAGIETDKTFTLVEEVATPLEITSSSAATCQPPPTPTAPSAAVVTLQFNHPIELADSGYPGGGQEALDDALTIFSPDADNDTVVNTLASDISDSTQERGVSMSIAADTLTISWNPAAGLVAKDLDDPIMQVSYGGLGNVQVRRVNAPSSAKTLATLVGAGSITCN